jgi:hypothetical protein
MSLSEFSMIEMFPQGGWDFLILYFPTVFDYISHNVSYVLLVDNVHFVNRKVISFEKSNSGIYQMICSKYN